MKQENNTQSTRKMLEDLGSQIMKEIISANIIIHELKNKKNNLLISDWNLLLEKEHSIYDSTDDRMSRMSDKEIFKGELLQVEIREVDSNIEFWRTQLKKLNECLQGIKQFR